MINLHMLFFFFAWSTEMDVALCTKSRSLKITGYDFYYVDF